MYCEFYIDVFFAVNLLMDFWVLCLTNVLLKGTASPLRAFWGAVFGALGMCGFLVFSREIHTAGLVIFYSISVLVMVRTGSSKISTLLSRFIILQSRTFACSPPLNTLTRLSMCFVVSPHFAKAARTSYWV